MKRKQLFRYVQAHKIDAVIYAIIALCLILFIVNIKDFGASWDEPMFYHYSSILPEIYIKRAQGIVFDGYDQFADLKYYGPAYLILGEFLARGLNLFPAFDVIDAWHILNYLTFAMGSLCLYWICQKFTDKMPALLAALLYFSQPLLLGHGVINPKDTPFSAFFLLSIWMGLRMIDAMNDEADTQPASLTKNTAKNYKWYVVIVLCTILTIVDRIGNYFLTRPLISSVLRAISGPEYTPGVNHKYAEKLSENINLFNTFFLCLLVILLIYALLKNSTKFQRYIFWAGITFGITLSIRIMGPAAGALVVLMWCLLEKPKKIIIPVIGYICIAVLVMYVTWPYLWGDPFSRFFESVLVSPEAVESFTVLFNGEYYHAHSLPWFYIIELIGIQVTIPALILSCFGLGLALWSLYKEPKQHILYLLPILWFCMPVFFWLILRPPTYDNFRHLHFILPAMFILAGMGLAWVLKRFKQPNIRVLIGAACVLPGIVANLYLHPYQYVYYNGLVGWSSKIQGRYEADYWGTSMCEAGRYLDSKIDADTRIFVVTYNLGKLLEHCTETSPQFSYSMDADLENQPDYAVVLARWGADGYFFSDMGVIHEISIGNTPLTVIRQAP